MMADSTAYTINNRGEVAFLAGFVWGGSVDRFNDSSIWSEAGGLHLVAREGDSAPGLLEGEVFNSFDTQPYSLTLSNAGDLAFRARVRGPGIDETNDDAIWVESDGQLLCGHR
jgi:hypothetical protein